MKELIFETKEEYLEMKKTWATYFNTEARHLTTDAYGYKQRKLQPEHFMIYALIRGKDPMVCIKGCSRTTLETSRYKLNSRWFYDSIIFNEIFGLKPEQIELIKKETALISFEEQPKNQINKRVPMTEGVLMSCLA